MPMLLVVVVILTHWMTDVLVAGNIFGLGMMASVVTLLSFLTVNETVKCWGLFASVFNKGVID